MKPKTLAAMAVASGLAVTSGLVALGATLMPSSATPRPVSSVTDAPAATEPSTTIVTDTVDVFDLPGPQPTEAEEPSESSGDDSGAPPSTAATSSSSTSSSSSHDDETREHESESSDDSSEGTESSSSEQHDD